MNKLEFLTKELVDGATKIIDDMDEIPKRRQGKAYQVPINNKFYPFKLLVTEAAKLSKIKLTTNDFGSDENNRSFFEKKTGYKCQNKGDPNNMFDVIIENFVKSLLNETTILKDFYPIVKKNTNYVWIKDHKKNIGKIIAHYEIIRHREKINVELHFEGDRKSKDFFLIELETLPDGLEWFTRQKGAKAIRVTDDKAMDSKNIVEELKRELLFLEESIGDKVRELIKNDDGTNSESESDCKVKFPLNQILYGPPGTGKTYNSINEAIKIINPKFYLKQDRNLIKDEYDRLVKNGQIVFTTFHQSMSYEDFIEGIKPLPPEGEGTTITYDIVDGIFKKICEEARKKKSNNFDEAYNSLIKKIQESKEERLNLQTKRGKFFQVAVNSNSNLTLFTGENQIKQGTLTKENIRKQLNGTKVFEGWESYFLGVANYLKENHNFEEKQEGEKNYVLVIDEINRGNVSSIFGELITLIEEDKRAGKDEALEVMLPYSKKAFNVPSNLYIIGTMNTADRSVEALDTALRRRFSFVEMPPDYELLEDKKVEGIELKNLLETINNRIEVLLDRDHLIGHSYFLNITKIDELKAAFAKQIIPLLQEYFYGDYGKIALVLGEEFCKPKPGNNKEVFADIDKNKYDSSPFEEKINFEISIPDTNDFSHAINVLLKYPFSKNEKENG